MVLFDLNFFRKQDLIAKASRALTLSLLCVILIGVQSANGQNNIQKSSQRPAAIHPAKASAQPEEKKLPRNLAFLLKRSGVFQLFVSALEQTNWLDKLSKEGPYTILAPRDAAFVHAESTPRDLIFGNKVKLKSFVEQHILPGIISLEQIKSMDTLQTVAGTSLPVEHKSPVKIAQSQIIRPDIQAENGIIHVLGSAKLVE